ncbi:hypothetical protein LTSERUB_2542, partial [Salmonella enterica subsp. enterica serovar Rubislaw str. A4-653]
MPAPDRCAGKGLAPQFYQPLTHQRVFQTISAIEIPGVAGAARAAAGDNCLPSR